MNNTEMDRNHLEKRLLGLYNDLLRAEQCDEETAKRVFNTDSKAEIIALINEEISELEAILNPDDEEDSGMDYDAICAVQGLARYC